jgi:ABC-type amino acid transport substrate-binding protein
MKIVIGGQVEKKEIEALVKQHGGPDVEVTVKSDLEAAMALKTGQADYYLGACYTGGGGALAMAIAIVGKSNCTTISMPGQPPTQEKVDQAITQGTKAFGFTADHKEKAVELVMKALTK